MAVTRINNNQISDASAGNAYVGINASTKLQPYSITSTKLANNLTYNSDFTVTGNLTVQGNTTAIDTTYTTVEDPILLLASNQTGAPSVDIGFVGQRGTSDNIAFVWDESADEFVTVYTVTGESNTTVSIASYADLHVGNGNVGGNLTINGTTTYVGNITGDLNVTGNIAGGNMLTNGVVIALGNITGSNLSAGSGTIVTTGNINGANVNASAGITAGTTVIATGNVTGGNLNTAGQVVATGNVTGGNLNTAGLTSTGTLAVSSTSTFTGNVTSSLNVTGNVNGGNIGTPGQVVATGNITGGNLITAGTINAATIETTGNVLVGGNLTVQGNIQYINVDDLRVEDPVIIMGTGPNGAPLTTNDGMDRGIYMEYYKASRGNSWIGWQNSSGNLVAAADVVFSGNNVVDINSYGTFQAGNIYSQSSVASGNITGGNLSAGSGIISTTGNINGGNLNATTNVTAAGGYFSSNVTIIGTLFSTSNIVANTSGIFYGNTITGNGAIYGGVPGYTSLGSDVVIQFAGNANSYSQVNFQNINSGTLASTDYIATADNGDDDNYYIDVGINSSTFNDPVDYPGFYPNDSYVHAHGGNLLINPETAGKVIKMMVGGTDTTDIIATVSTSGLKMDQGVIDTPNITSSTGRVTVNNASDDVDFAVNGDTTANVLYVDAGTGTVSVGSATQTTNAIFAMNATNSFLMPVGNTAQRPGVGVTGMLRFNSTLDAVEVYDTVGWTTVGTPNFTVITDQQFNGDGSTVSFTLNEESTTNSTIVSINGIVQIPTIAYSVGGAGNDILTFTEAPQTGDIIDVRKLTTTTQVTSISNSPGNAVVQVNPTSAIVQITGDLNPTSNVTFDLGSPTARWNELYLAGSTITLGDIVIKDVGSNQIGFFRADGTTPATIDSNNVDTTTIANGTSSISVIASGGNIRANVGGATIIQITSQGINNGQANGVGNIGNSTGYFNTVFAKATSAQYADLAEVYAADAKYEPGTVLSFGGEAEVTVSTVASDSRIAGVVSTNPSYVMNATLTSEYTAVVALTGRVPTLVTGPVSKGDMMVSGGNGRAVACTTPAMGTVIGKALENHASGDGVIEVVVGRL